MDKSGASAYVYAKASGIIARSFVGNRTIKLFETKSLSELWSLIFNTEVPMVPEIMLAKQIEVEAQKKFIKQYIDLVSCYSKPEPIFTILLRFYEYSNLKDVVSSLVTGKNQLPSLVDIGKFATIDYSKYPDLAKMTENTEFAWCTEIPDIHKEKDFEYKLDLQYVRSVWAAIQKLPKLERIPVENFIKQSFSQRNVAWVVRLKLYYKYTNEQIKKRLLSISENPTENDPIAGEAIKVLDLPVDSWADWKQSVYSDCLNPYLGSDDWTVDPRWLQQAMSKKNNALALKTFRQYPFTANVLVTWFKMKQFELDCIRTAAEGLRLNVSSSEIKKIAGFEQL